MHFPAIAQRRFNHELAPIHTALEVTVSRNPILLQVMSPSGVVDGINTIVTEQEGAQSTEESQVPEFEEKFSLPYNQSLLSSTQDSMESIAVPQEAALDDEQIRILLASPRYLLERQASAERSQVNHFGREGLMSSSSQSLNFFGTGKPVAWLSLQKRMRQDDSSKREQPAEVSRFYESVFRDANPANDAKSLLKGNRVHLLTQARTN